MTIRRCCGFHSPAVCPRAVTASHRMQILKLHDMKVDLPRPKLLAARRLDRAVTRLQSSNRTGAATAKAITAADRSQYSTMTRKREAGGPGGAEVGVKGVRAGAPAQATERRGTKSLRRGDFGGVLSGTDIEDAPPLDAELMGIGVLPFLWYEGCVKDLELFGNVALETDEVASSPDVSSRTGASITLSRDVSLGLRSV